MPFKQGIAFRSSRAYVTDGPDDDFSGNNFGAATYPSTTAQGNVVGWEQTTQLSVLNRSTSVDPRLAGINYLTSAATNTWRFDLPAPGTYNIRIAAGAVGVRMDTSVELFDGATSLGLLFQGTTLADHFFDATGVDRTTAAWPTDNAVLTVTFTSTICRLLLSRYTGAGGFQGGWAYAYIEAASGGATIAVNLSAAQSQSAVATRRPTLARAATQAQNVTLGRNVAVTEAATQTASAVISRALAASRAASQTCTAALARAAGLTRSSSAAQSASLYRAAALELDADQAQTAQARRDLALGLIATQTQSATALFGTLYQMTLAAVQSVAASMTRAAALTASASQASAATIVRAVTATRSATQAQTAAVAKVIAQSFAAAQAQTASLLTGRLFVMALAATQACTATARRAVSLTARATQTATATVAKRLARVFVALQRQLAGMTRTGGEEQIPAVFEDEPRERFRARGFAARIGSLANLITGGRIGGRRR